jgi:hypothetical protein
LYGTTLTDINRTTSGSVYKLQPSPIPSAPWRLTPIYYFSDATGTYPSSELILDNSGALYGANMSGTSHQEGTIFKLTPPATGKTAWTETNLHVFGSQQNDGIYPQGKIVLDSTGAVYGVAAQGGGNANCGVVFKLSPPAAGGKKWSESILYRFASSCYPVGGLIMDKFGDLLGTTQQGGPGGTLFALLPPTTNGGKWSESVLHTFGTANDGYTPLSGLLLRNNVLYGTTADGPNVQGTAFKYNLN